MIEHEFTHKIISILDTNFDGRGREILQFFDMLKYINIKTKAANRGSKSRASYANLYAIYVLIEDYLNGDFNHNHNYSNYTGAKFVNLLTRQRELPFGGKLQNHALNHRLNEEFKKYFPSNDNLPVIRDTETNRYWINELLIQSNLNKRHINIALSVKQIIDAYIETRQNNFSNFIKDCEELMAVTNKSPDKAIEFIIQLLNPNVDARIFEIVTYSILKYYYLNQKIYWGWSREEITEDNLTLYKTGRTNANDGGIDFVMKPLGRFFQVTETVNAGVIPPFLTEAKSRGLGS